VLYDFRKFSWVSARVAKNWSVVSVVCNARA
jgi:hypothetical protein